MIETPTFLDVNDVLEAHDAVLAEHGGAAGVRDLGALESAVGMAGATFDGAFSHEDVWQMAAAYGFHIAEAQAFLDGNKRTVVLCATTFLIMNGIRLREEGDFLYTAMLDIAARRVSKDDLADLLLYLAAAPEP